MNTMKLLTDVTTKMADGSVVESIAREAPRKIVERSAQVLLQTSVFKQTVIVIRVQSLF